MCNFFFSIIIYRTYICCNKIKYQPKTFLDFLNDNSLKCIINENKINELEKKIKKLELIIKEKDIIINEEKVKLNRKIKELENILNIKKSLIIELENEINLFRKYCYFSEREKLISIKFISGEQDIDYSIITKNTKIFTELESMIYQKYPNYMKTKNYFLGGGNIINKNKTLEQNKIKNNDIITLMINNLD